MLRWFLIVVLAFGGGCPASSSSSKEVAPEPIVISIVGTNDLHGHLDRLPILAGYVANLRARRERDGGAVVLIDAGDMFQGTLESNLNEGAAVIDAYNAIGYAAATLGNHEFDFGPVGPASVAREPGDDPRGAIRARGAQARFPLLAANILDAATGHRVRWPALPASTIRRTRGVAIGIIGVATIATPTTTMPANFRGLAIAPLAQTIASEARALRARGADLIVVTAHAGGKCERFDDPDDLSSCDPQQEIVGVARALDPRQVDVIVAGHTHAGVAHRINGIAVIESFALGRAFGRVDITFDRRTRRRVGVRIHPPTWLCTEPKASATDCASRPYEGKPVIRDEKIARLIEGPTRAALSVRNAPLGINVSKAIWRSRTAESPLGNLFTDLMLVARPKADVAITNGGGLRAAIPAGPLTYGALYRASPFDNRFAMITLTGEQLAQVIRRNLQSRSGIFSLSGLFVEARCKSGALEVTLLRPDGRAVGAGEKLLVATSDFLASGGDRAFAELGLAKDAIVFESGKPIRDYMADLLRKRGGSLRGDDPALFDPGRRRIRFRGRRPVRCR